MKKTVAAMLLSMTTMMITGCSGHQLAGNPLLQIQNRETEISSEATDRLVRKVRPYAAMSELAYRTYSSGQIVMSTVGRTDGKSEEEIEAVSERLDDWRQLDDWLKQQRWEFLGHKEASCGENRDVALDLWVNKTTLPPQVVVAFSGTSDREKGRARADIGEEVMEACRIAGPGAVVTATGHSLGGSVAEHLFYASLAWPNNSMADVTVFDSPPVRDRYEYATGKDRKKARSQFNASLAAMATRWRFPEVMAHQYGFGTIRVTEGGDLLRSLFGLDDAEDVSVAELKFKFGRGEALAQKGMANLAMNLLYYPGTPPMIVRVKKEERSVKVGAVKSSVVLDAELQELLNRP